MIPLAIERNQHKNYFIRLVGGKLLPDFLHIGNDPRACKFTVGKDHGHHRYFSPEFLQLDRIVFLGVPASLELVDRRFRQSSARNPGMFRPGLIPPVAFRPAASFSRAARAQPKETSEACERENP